MLNRMLICSSCLIAIALAGCGQAPSVDTAATPAPAATAQTTTTVASPPTPIPAQPVPAVTQPPVATNVVAVAKPESTKAEPGPTTAAPVEREPSVLLSSRKKGVLIIAIDFAFSPAMNNKLSLEERRQYVAQRTIDLYAREFARHEKAGQKIKVFAYSVPNKDDYDRGDFRNISELAIFETTHDLLKDDTASSAARLGATDWRAALK